MQVDEYRKSLVQDVCLWSCMVSSVTLIFCCFSHLSTIAHGMIMPWCCFLSVNVCIKMLPVTNITIMQICYCLWQPYSYILFQISQLSFSNEWNQHAVIELQHTDSSVLSAFLLPPPSILVFLCDFPSTGINSHL